MSGINGRTRRFFARYGKHAHRSLAKRMQRRAIWSGKPFQYAKGRDYQTGLKGFLLRLVATIREMAR